MKKFNIPALVLGGGPTALAMIRCLGREGIDVYSAGHREGLVQKSRFYKPLKGIDPEEVTPGNAIKFINQLKFDRLVLLPCSDQWVETLAEPSLNIPDRYCLSIPKKEAILQLIDKKSLSETMKKLSLPHPQTIIIDSVDDLEKIDQFQPGDFFLKPCDSHKFHKHYNVKAFSVNSKKEAIEIYQKAEKENIKLLLQKYVQGDADNHYYVEGFVDRHGETKAWFARQRIRMFPPLYGNSSYMETVALDMVKPALETAQKILDFVKYRSVFSIEFKFDKKDDKFYLIELNARPWWYIEVAYLCGINFPMMIYKDALSIDFENQNSYATGKKFYSPYFDISACQIMFREKSISIFEWIISWLKARQVFFRWDDPYPTIHRLIALAKEKFNRG